MMLENHFVHETHKKHKKFKRDTKTLCNISLITGKPTKKYHHEDTKSTKFLFSSCSSCLRGEYLPAINEKLGLS